MRQDRREGNSKHFKSVDSPFVNRALPPLPKEDLSQDGDVIKLNNILSNFDDNDCIADEERHRNYCASIEKVKDCGWYWGPISGQLAEEILSDEPEGSFIVRDSSDERYFFSLSFKLDSFVRHARIEHDQGYFSFGPLQKFKCNTIVDFIENSVEHSRSGRYLFFLHEVPVVGPMRVQLLHPVSRLRSIQSLQHLCRFIILKYVRRDLIDKLPLPIELKTYLNTPYYYSEKLSILEKNSEK